MNQLDYQRKVIREEYVEGVNTLKKPPFGLMPKYIWENRRLKEITAAINRYIKAELVVPNEWMEEYNELVGKQNRGN